MMDCESKKRAAGLIPAASTTMNATLPTPTDQQRAAIAMRAHSVALSAGAGCGKTFVLGERFLSYLAPHAKSGNPAAELSELVAFTYTDRAAREMRDRIRRMGRERLVAAGEDQADYWLDLVRQIDAARISTVHSFCTSLLRRHAVQAGLDPNFEVLDAPLAEALRLECLDDVLRERLILQDAAALGLLRRFGLNSTRDKIAAMLKARDKRDMAAFAGLAPADLTARWDQRRPDVYRSILQELSRHPSFIETLSLARMANIPNPELNQNRQFLAEQLPQLSAVDGPATLIDQLHDATMLGRSRGEKHWGSDQPLIERYKEALKTLREKLRGAKKTTRLGPRRGSRRGRGRPRRPGAGGHRRAALPRRQTPTAIARFRRRLGRNPRPARGRC